MITADRLRRIFLLSLPIIGGMISQNILNIVDIAMVGHLGPAALAAVGVASFAVFMSQALVLGVSSGVQAVASRRVGEGYTERAGVSLTSGLLFSLSVGGLFTVLIYPLIPELFPLLNSDVEVIQHGNDYWQIRMLSMIFMGANYAFRGYFNGIGSPHYYMWTLVFVHILNIVLNYILIFGHFGFEAMGTRGAAWASTIATVAGTFLYILLGSTRLKFLSMFAIPSWRDFKSVCRLSLPAGIQQLLIAMGMTSLFWMVGKIGVSEVAALNILINILMLCILPGFGFGMAAATLVGTSLGEKDKAKAKTWAIDVAKVAGVITCFAGLFLALNAENILSVFTDDAATIRAACLPLQITGALIFIDVVGLIFMNALLGSGDVGVVLKTSIAAQWLVFFPLGVIAIYFFNPPLVAIWLLFSFSRIGQGAVYFVAWQREQWGMKRL